MKESSKHRPNVPNLRFPGNKKDWTTKNLGELLDFKITNSFSRDKLNYDKGTVKNIHYGDIHKKFQTLLDINFEEVPFINEDITLHKISNESYCKEGDIIFADASEDLNDVGKSIEILNLNCEKLLAGLHTLQGRPKPNNFHKGFLGYLLKSNRVRSQIKKEAQGTKVLSINVGRISRINISFPSLVEQKKITDLFFKINQRIQTQNKIIEDYKLFKKGMMQKLFKQEIRFKDKEGRDYPKWRKKKLSDLAIIKTGSSNRQDSGLKSKYTFFDRSEDIRTSDIYLFDCEAIIVAGEGSAFIPKYFIGKFDLHQRTYAIMGYEEFVNGKFLYYYIHQNRNYFLRQAVGSTVKSLRLPMFQKMDIEIPILKEQQKMAETLTSIDRKIELETEILAQLNQQKQYFLQNLFI